MLLSTARRLCLARMAAASAAEFAELVRAEGGDAPAAGELWVDDTAAARAAQEAHVRSPEYRELHRPALTTSAMGLFGGEPGFEKAHRVWVDPDRPHMRHIYNQTDLARNLRYARYGYFKRDMHILDVDKLVRHARMLPTPSRLLTDFLYQRVPLPDRSCAALLRHAHRQLTMLSPWERGALLASAEEMFERMLSTNIPPVEVGPETHAEMIRCCAVCGEWERGWEVYYARALEMEEESPELFVADTYLFDAAMELCVACERPREGMLALEEAIRRHLRPRATMLDKALVLASLAAEKLPAAEGGGDADETAALRDTFLRHGLDAWSLYDFYQLERSAASVEAYMRFGALFGLPEQVVEALASATAAGTSVPLSCYGWLLYALRATPGMGDYVMDVFAQLGPRGLTPDYALFTLAFMYCAHQRDGELALALYTQHYVHLDLNPTPELVLLFLQACAACEAPSLRMLSAGEALMQRLEATGSTVDLIGDIYDQYVELASVLGAVGAGLGTIKRLVSFGKPLTTRQMNSLLLANSNAPAPNGGAAVTEELAATFRLLRVAPNDDTLDALRLCLEAFGTTDALDEWHAALTAAAAAAPGGTLGRDAPSVPLDTPPHRLRALKTTWAIDPKDIALRRFGQTVRMPGKTRVGSMLGSVVPFGRNPGERDV